MKKLLILLIGLTILSCSLGNDTRTNYQVFLPIESAILPEEFSLNETYEITINYLKPTECHAFNDILHVKENNVIKIVLINTVFVSDENCAAADTQLQATFNFEATETGTYIFKFWQGQDDYGEDSYLTVEVPVLE